MKKTYYISVTETLNRVVAVEAETFGEACAFVGEATHSGELKLSTIDDFVDRDFTDETEDVQNLIDLGIVNACYYQKIN